MNQIDLDYQNLVRDILENGHKKNDRTGTGTISVFGRTIRHSMKDGFPLLTTKKMAWKTMVTELLFFLRGETNLRFLVDRNCHIWDGDAYKNYVNKQTTEDVGSMNWFIEQIKTDDEFAKKWGELGPIYPKQWRSWRTPERCGAGDLVEFPNDDRRQWPKIIYKNIDQIANVINLLKTDPDSRRMIVSAWNVGELDQMVLPPCHMMFQFYTRELNEKEGIKKQGLVVKYKGNDCKIKDYSNANHELLILDTPEGDRVIYENQLDEPIDYSKFPTRAISLRWDQRSVDVGLGLPFNIASYALLLEIIAKSVNMVPEELIGDLGDCHIYNNHIDGLKEQLTRVPYELPSVNINTEWWPTESGECGVGPIDATAVFNSFTNDHFCKCLLEDDIQLYNYQSHPSIKLPLSN